MDKRKNLRNPDLLAHDYVSVLIQWDDAPSFIFRVAKVLGSSFPFNAEMLSITGSDSNLTVDFRFESSFDINTSPWQFELEVAFTTATAKFKPSAMYNASNNLIKVRFALGGNTIPPNSYLVFTAKRYRPNTQYLAELAAASASPVTIQGGGVSTEIPTVTAATESGSNTVQGFYFVAPAPSFTINTITRNAPPLGNTGYTDWNVKILKLNAAMPTSSFSVLYQNSTPIPFSTTSVGVSVVVNPSDRIVVLTNNINPTLFFGDPVYFGVTGTNTFSSTINGTPVSLIAAQQTPNIDISVNTGITISSTIELRSSIKLFYGGAATWSNIIY